MRVLVTGVAGFIGSRLANRLLHEGHEVVGIDCFVPYYPKEIKLNNLLPLKDFETFTFLEKDLVKIDITEECGEFDVIFHQAAQAGVRASWGSYFSSYLQNNILASQAILESLLNNNLSTKVVYASSSSVYGNAESFPTTESVTPAPVSPYGVTKLGGEHLMRLYSSQYGIHTVSLRYFTVYGPGQRPDMAFHRFCKAALSKQQIHIYGDGEQSRDFTFIDDAINANILAAQNGVSGGVYNIGGGEITTVNAVISSLREISGLSLDVKYTERQVGDARHTSADTTLAQSELQFLPQVKVLTGLQKELEWVEKNLEILCEAPVT